MVAFRYRIMQRLRNATALEGAHRRLGRRLHGEPRPLHRQHRVPGHPGGFRRHPSPASPGCSTRTRSSSPPSSSRPAASPTAIGRKRGFIAGLGALPRRLGALRHRAVGRALVAARVIQAAGAALLMPDVARAPAAGVPAERARRRDRHLGRRRRRRRRGRPAHRRPARRGLVAAGLPRQPPGRARRCVVRDAAAAREPQDETPGPRPGPRSAPRLLTPRSGALALGLVQAPEWGWSDARDAARVRGRRRRRCRCSCAQRAHPAPVVDLEMLRVRSFAAANTAAVLFFAAFGGDAARDRPLHDRRVGRLGPRRPASSSPPGRSWPRSSPRGPAGSRATSASARLAGAGAAIFALGAAWWLVAARRDTELRRRDAPRPPAHGRRRRPDDPVAVERGGVVAAARALRDRHRGPDDVAADRLRPRASPARRDRRRRARRDFEGAWMLMIAASALGIRRRHRDRARSRSAPPDPAEAPA